ncbi:MAG: DUF6134 family protein [Steroidobacteraceae bacterium]
MSLSGLLSISTSRLVLLALFAVSDVAAEDKTASWDFRVYLDGKPIGYHHFSLVRSGERSELHSDAQFDVKVLFINAYHYEHHAVERWQGNCLQNLSAYTDDNGKLSTVSAALEGDALLVTSRQHYSLRNCVMSFAYWNPRMLSQGRLLNAQTGEYEPVQIKMVDAVPLQVRGVEQPSRHYRLAGAKLSIDLWYSPDDDWLALESTTENGRRLRYQLQ